MPLTRAEVKEMAHDLARGALVEGLLKMQNIPGAACKGRDLHHPESYSTGRMAPVSSHAVRVAKALCATCPVRRECLEAGMSEPAGIWGGTTGVERAGCGPGDVEELLDRMMAQAIENGLAGGEGR